MGNTLKTFEKVSAYTPRNGVRRLTEKKLIPWIY